jgi:hypothetical protein
MRRGEKTKIEKNSYELNFQLKKNYPGSWARRSSKLPHEFNS